MCAQTCVAKHAIFACYSCKCSIFAYMCALMHEYTMLGTYHVHTTRVHTRAHYNTYVRTDVPAACVYTCALL